MKRTSQAHRGSALMLAVILSGIVAVITASYLQMATNESKNSYMSFLRNGAFNLAEAGAEEAVWALNNEDTASWTKHATEDKLFKKTPGFDYDEAKSTLIEIVISDPNGDPSLISRGTITMPDGRTIEKIISIALAPRLMAPNGLTAKDSIAFSGGNVSFDAYDSKDTSLISSVEDEGSVATTSIVNDAANISNSDVMGGVATGGGTVGLGPNARVFNENDINDYGSSSLVPSGYINPDLVTNDFRSDFPDMDLPSGGNYIGSISNDTSLGDGVYIVDSVALSGKQTLNITGDVTLVVKGDVSVGGKAQINLDQTNGKLELYIDGNMDVGGNGIINTGSGYSPTAQGDFGVSPDLAGNYPKPENLMIYGTSDGTTSQSFSYSGNAALAGVIYAPNADVALNGGGNGGELLGAIVAENIKVTGTYGFHYDVQLKDLFFKQDSYRMTRWGEITEITDRTEVDKLIASF